MSPVTHDECMTNNTGSLFCRAPLTKAIWTSPVSNLLETVSAKSPCSVGMFGYFVYVPGSLAACDTQSSLLSTRASTKIYRLLFELWQARHRAIFIQNFNQPPAARKPANHAKSMAASVWPALHKTPSFFAFNGKMCRKSFPNSSF